MRYHRSKPVGKRCASAEVLREKPLCVFSCCPAAPLKWSDVTSQNPVDCARWSIPVEFISMPLCALRERASREVERLIAQYTPSRLADGRKADPTRLMEAEAKRYGMTALP